MDLNLRINIDLAKSTNYIPMGFWVKPVAGDPKKPFYRITDLGIPMVKVEDGSALGYSVYVLNVDVSDDVVPSASNPQWRLIESTELIYIQQAFIERLWTQMLIAEGAEIGGFEIKDGLLQSKAKDTEGNPLIVLNGNTGHAEITGTIYATSGIIDKDVTIKGNLSGVSGSFKTLECVNNLGESIGKIRFGSDGNIWFESCGLYHQAPTAPFYLADAWVRGVFGGRERTAIRITASGAYVYKNGLSNTSEYISLVQKTSALGETYYEIPLYSPTSASSGCPIDIVIINHNSSINYELEKIPGKTVVVINSNDYNNNVWIYSNGVRRNMPGGQAATFVCVGPFQNPDNSSILGRGWLVSGYFDNTWH